MTPPDAKAQDEAKPQRLHLGFGGELKSLESHEFPDPEKLDIVGIFPDFASAERAWRAKAQATVDSAQTRYFIVHLHRMMGPVGLARKAGGRANGGWGGKCRLRRGSLGRASGAISQAGPALESIRRRAIRTRQFARASSSRRRRHVAW